MKNIFLFITLFSLLFASCRKNTADPISPVAQHPEEPPPDPLDSTNSLLHVDTTQNIVVYIAVASFDRSTSFYPYPIHWKNGVQVHLPHPGPSYGNAISVSGNDVHIYI